MAPLTRWFELGRGGSHGNVRPMEGLRGLAVFLVFLAHYGGVTDPWLSDHPGLRTFARDLHPFGASGVDLFFVLSGYLIYGSLLRGGQPYLRFIGRRVQRLHPAFLTVLALYLALGVVSPADNKVPAGWWHAVGFLAANVAFLPGLFPVTPVITAAWSLSYELFFYLVVPVLIVLAGLRRRSIRWRLGFLTALAAVGLGVGAVEGGPVRLAMFVAGMLLHDLLQLRATWRRPGSVVGGVALAAGPLAMVLPFPVSHAGDVARVVVLFACLLVAGLACFARPVGHTAPDGPLARACSWTPLRWLGNMSYSHYLTHGLTLRVAFRLVERFAPPSGGQGPMLFWVLLAPMFALTLVASAGLFLLVERPLSLRTAAAPRPAAAPVPVVAAAVGVAQPGG